MTAPTYTDVFAGAMVNEVRRQLQDVDIREGRKDPDYRACIRISTTASLREMIGPGCLVTLNKQ